MKRKPATTRGHVRRAGRRGARVCAAALLLCLPLLFLSACAEIPTRVGEAAESEAEMPPFEETVETEQEEAVSSPPEDAPPVETEAETETPPPDDTPEEITPETDVSQSPDAPLSDAGFGEMLLYSIDDEMFQLPRADVPYYEAGEVVFKTEAFFQQAEQDDQAWRSDPLWVTFNLCRNLLGNQQDILCADETVSEGELTTKAGLTIRVTPPIDGASEHSYTAEMTAPGLGQYRITMDYMAGTSVLYIRRIGFVPGISKNSLYKDILIYSLGDDVFSDRLRTEVPEYSRGKLLFKTEEFFQSRMEGGHQPWRSNPLYVVQILCWNLLGDRMQEFLPHEDYVTETLYRVETQGGLVILLIPMTTNDNWRRTVEMIVPDLGKYIVTTRSVDVDAGVVYVETITFTPD
jgi:hypothetical protein